MDAVLNEFIQLLRRHELRVSVPEHMDALEALALVGLAERALVRDALEATLVKSSDDSATFGRLFDLYFGLHQASPAAAAPALVPLDHNDGGQINKLEFGNDLPSQGESGPEAHNHDQGTTDMRRFFDEEQLRPTRNFHDQPDKMRLSVFAQELILNRKQGGLQELLRKITHQLRVRRARNMFQPGGLAPHSESEELPLDVSAAEMQELIDHLEALELDEELIAQLKNQSEAIVQGLPQLFKQLLERQRQLAGPPPDLTALAQRSLRQLTHITPVEQRAMEAAVRRIARRINGALARRMRPSRSGRINVGQTLRRNLHYDGVPFQPVLRRRHEQRPRLVIMCDVSLSTRNLARFWLHLLHQMQNLFSKVRTFVFVADMVEVTHLFDHYDLNRAVDAIFNGGVLDVDTHSDFGRAAQQFCEMHLNAVNHRTTVVVLGDGRNNGKAANEAALRTIAGQARQLIWLTPEPKWGWKLGSCDMPRYAPLCSRVEVVRTIEQFANIAESLTQTR